MTDIVAQTPSTAVQAQNLNLLEDHETQMSALRAALVAGEESGPATPFDFDQFIAEKKS